MAKLMDNFTSTLDKQFEAWNKVAPHIDFNLEIDIKRLQNYITFNSKILDFGCGYGRNSNLLASVGFTDLMGVDSSIEMINRGNQDFPHLKLMHNVTNKLVFPDNTFDLILVCGVFTCIPDNNQCDRIITELSRVLKPKGVIHLIEFCSEVGQLIHSNFGVEMKHRKPRELSNLLGSFEMLNSEVLSTTTLSGNEASSYRYFGVKGT